MEETHEKENWKPVVGYEGLYEVSDFGRVRNVADRIGTFIGKILKPATTDGSKRFVLCNHGKTQNVRCHKLVMAAFVGPRPEGLQVKHIDGDKGNNLLGNLEYAKQPRNDYYLRSVAARRKIDEELAKENARMRHPHQGLQAKE